MVGRSAKSKVCSFLGEALMSLHAPFAQSNTVETPGHCQRSQKVKELYLNSSFRKYHMDDDNNNNGLTAEFTCEVYQLCVLSLHTRRTTDDDQAMNWGSRGYMKFYRIRSIRQVSVFDKLMCSRKLCHYSSLLAREFLSLTHTCLSLYLSLSLSLTVCVWLH